MATGNNIEALRKARGWSRPQLAERMGTSPQQVERLEKGQRRLAQDWIERAARALGVELADIIATTPPAQLPDILPTRSADVGETVELIVLDLSLSMGPGTLIEDMVEGEPIQFDLAFLRSITRSVPSRLRLVKGIGDSMEPTLFPGDRVMVDTTERAYSRIHGVYWINHLGAHGIKRLRAVGSGRMLIISDNPRVDDYEVDADDLRIEGRVIWYAREI
jgi:phage repressor protein C with HTH and peptisase S24 domain